MRPIFSSLASCFACFANMALAQEPGHWAKVDTKLLNMRSAPSIEGAVVGQLPEGTLMLVKEQQNGWIKLSDPMKRGLPTGWVNGAYVQDIGSASTGDQSASAGDSEQTSREPKPTPQYASLPNPFSIFDAEFDCNEMLVSPGLSDCTLEVTVKVSIPSAYEPFMADYVDVQCDAEVSYRTKDSYFQQSDRGTEMASVSLYSSYVTETLEIDFDFGFNLEPVVSAEVSSLSCNPY